MGDSTDEHLGGCNYTDPMGDPATWAPEVWDAIIDEFKIKSVLDVGCGYGYSTRYFMNKGLVATGVEGYVPAIENNKAKDHVIFHDYATGAYIPDKPYDLCWSCEFVEHVEEKYMLNFLTTFQACRVVAMTFARPGQSGHHHVNEQSQEYWVQHVQRLGYKFCEEFSMQMRKLVDAGPHGGHIRERILVFEKN